MAFARVGIVAGVADELAAFMPAALRVPLGGEPAVARVDAGGRAMFLCRAGIGKVAAATAATVLHARHGIELLVVIGTAGRIGGEGAVEAGAPFLVVEAVQADFGAQRPAGLVRYTAGDWPIGEARLAPLRPLPVPPGGLATARIATSDLFVECGRHAAGLHDALGPTSLDATLVDMETAAVAQVAALLGVPWLAIKATTDAADEASVAGFRANLAMAAGRAAAAMERLLETI